MNTALEVDSLVGCVITLAYSYVNTIIGKHQNPKSPKAAATSQLSSEKSDPKNAMILSVLPIVMIKLTVLNDFDLSSQYPTTNAPMMPHSTFVIANTPASSSLKLNGSMIVSIISNNTIMFAYQIPKLIHSF